MNILLFGANGQLGWELQRALSPLGTVTALGHREADLAHPVLEHIDRHRPDAIVNAAAYTAVDQAESEPELALRVNAGAVGEMAQAAAQRDALLVHYSTDYVFDGQSSSPYAESDPTRPLSSYGRSKLAGEVAIRAVPACRHLIFRTSWVYSVRGQNFARTILKRARTLDNLRVIADTFGVPTSAELLADVTALVLHRLQRERSETDFSHPAAAHGAIPERNDYGTYHLVPSGTTTWHEYACFLIEQARDAGIPIRVAPQNIAPVPASAFPAPAQRPKNSRLDSSLLSARFALELPDWRLHLRRFVDAVARERE